MKASFCALAFLSMAAWAEAAPRPLAAVGRVSLDSGVISDAFALDDSGRTLAWIETTGEGSVRMHVAPVGAKASAAVDLTSFTVTPERIHYLGGQWFIVATDGEKRSAAVVSGHRLGARIGPFGDALVSRQGGAKFVTVTERGESAGRSFTVAAYRPAGTLVAQKRITVSPEGTIAGTDLGFIGFIDGYLRALVKKPGAYNARADARGPAQIAVYDVLTGRPGPGKVLPDIPRFLDFAVKRGERPGAEVFVRRDDDGQGLELVGPADQLRPLKLPEKLSAFEPGPLMQQAPGGRLVLAMVRDPITEDVAAVGKKGERRLVLFAVDTRTARLSPMGEVPLGEEQEFAWSVGGNRIAVLRKTQANAGTLLEVY
jgi:hypothetical protein